MEPAASFQKVGRYELIRKIATGGMAELFVARFTGPGGFEKRCALKRILPQFTEDQEFSRMFLNEARIAALFDHPNIAQVFDFGVDESNGQLFMAMELINGVDLRHVLRLVRERGVRCPPELAAYIVAQALDGLAYAHGFHDDSGRPLNLVHRDVSPQNILVSFEGAVKLVDFGIACTRIGRLSGTLTAKQTTAGSRQGRPSYAAPELLRASPYHIDRLDDRADLYALGATLWCLVCGAPPFVADNDVALLDAIARQPVPRLRDVALGDDDDDDDDDLDALLNALLAKDPADRPHSAKDVAASLRAWLRARDVDATAVVADTVGALALPSLATAR